MASRPRCAKRRRKFEDRVWLGAEAIARGRQWREVLGALRLDPLIPVRGIFVPKAAGPAAQQRPRSRGAPAVVEDAQPASSAEVVSRRQTRLAAWLAAPRSSCRFAF
jgi:hypothetical protein